VYILCKTRFDITATNVHGQMSHANMPFTDAAGKSVTDTRSWNRSRNQQRNWETINQIISLRALPQEITEPRRDSGWWSFRFKLEQMGQIELNNDPVGALIEDCRDVPMITGLDEDPDIGTTLDPDTNIVFVVKHNK